MARTLFFKLLNYWQQTEIFSQCNISYNYEYFFVHLRFDFFSIIAKEVKSVLQPVFPDYVISCDYDLTYFVTQHFL